MSSRSSGSKRPRPGAAAPRRARPGKGGARPVRPRPPAAAAATAGAPRAPVDPAILPRVVLVGRPNAGKSTLFNRLLRRRRAVVDPTPGVTRDPVEAVASLDERPVLLVDTGGFDVTGVSGIDAAVRARSLDALARAAVVLYVLDGAAGLSPADAAAARALRQRHRNVLFVLNKLDSPGRAAAATDFWELGADDLLAVSAEHGLGIGDLVETVVAHLPPETEPAPATGDAPADRPVAVALIGRPNVGKSSLVNRLLGFERSLVDAVAGTTRDAVDTLLEDRGRRYLLVDTAGLRRRSRVQERLERAATAKSLETLARADVAVIVLDASEGVTAQDQRLAARAWEAGRGVVVVANKADLLATPTADFVDDVRRALGRLAGVPVVPTSAITAAGVEAILPAVDRVASAHARELKTRKLNDVVTAAVRAKEPPLVGQRRPRIFYATQTGRRPPEVTVFVSNPQAIHPSYQRYLENQVAEAFGLAGTPLRLRLRGRR